MRTEIVVSFGASSRERTVGKGHQAGGRTPATIESILETSPAPSSLARASVLNTAQGQEALPRHSASLSAFLPP